MKTTLLKLTIILIGKIAFCQNVIVEYNNTFNSNSYKNELHIENTGSYWRYKTNDQKTIEENLIDLFIIKKYEEETIYMNEEILNSKHLVKDSLNTFKWKLENETKTILGYTCKLATTYFRGRRYNAYYTVEIAYPEGPWKFYGLPGLILSISSEDNLVQYEATKIDFNSNKIINLNIATKEKYITWEEYQKKFIVSFDNYIKKIKASGAIEDGADVNIKIISPEIIYPKIQGGDGIKF